MKAVTIRQPFAWAIAAGFKDIEKRSWAPHVEPGELVAIHAAVAAPDADDVTRVQKRIGRRARVPVEYDCGAIVGVARVAKVVTSWRSAWFSGPLGWVLEERDRGAQADRVQGAARPLEPTPFCRGAPDATAAVSVGARGSFRAIGAAVTGRPAPDGQQVGGRNPRRRTRTSGSENRAASWWLRGTHVNTAWAGLPSRRPRRTEAQRRGLLLVVLGKEGHARLAVVQTAWLDAARSLGCPGRLPVLVDRHLPDR